ncbi:winged helix-turn-helix transcriptional regulator [Neorhizobium sp. LMR1-1-1.1]
MSCDHSFDVERASELLSVLSNPKRLEIFELISQREWDVNSLARKLNMSQSSLSQHLKKMRDLKVVSARRDARAVYYSSQNESVSTILASLTQIFASGKTVEPAT